MKILVTGGAGFIGSNYISNLIANESQWTEITILDALTYAGNLTSLKNSLKDKRCKFVKGDIRDTEIVEEVMKDVNTVVHFAAESHVDRSIKSPSEFMSTNVLGTSVLLNAAYKYKIQRFLHISTDEVYGSINEGSWDEHSILKPNSPYSASKASSDLLALSYWRTFGVPVIVTRCSNNFGAFQNPEKFIPLAITNLIDSLPIPIYGNGENSRDWLNVIDHCNALNLVLQFGTVGEIYNIGGGTELTNIDTAKLLIQILKKDETFIEFVEDRKAHDFRYSVNFEKLTRDCGYIPKKSFETSILETVEWYQANSSWWRTIKDQQKVYN